MNKKIIFLLIAVNLVIFFSNQVKAESDPKCTAEKGECKTLATCAYENGDVVEEPEGGYDYCGSGYICCIPHGANGTDCTSGQDGYCLPANDSCMTGFKPLSGTSECRGNACCVPENKQTGNAAECAANSFGEGVCQSTCGNGTPVGAAGEYCGGTLECCVPQKQNSGSIYPSQCSSGNTGCTNANDQAILDNQCKKYHFRSNKNGECDSMAYYLNALDDACNKGSCQYPKIVYTLSGTAYYGNDAAGYAQQVGTSSLETSSENGTCAGAGGTWQTAACPGKEKSGPFTDNKPGQYCCTTSGLPGSECETQHIGTCRQGTTCNQGETLKTSLCDSGWVCCAGSGSTGTGVYIPTSGETGLSDKSIQAILINILDWLTGIIGFIALIGFIISGIQYVVASGNEEIMESAKKNMTYSIIGIAVALGGLVIVRAIDAALKAMPLF